MFDRLQLIEGEKSRLYASDHQRVVLKQFFFGLRKAIHKLVGVLDSLSIELPVGRAHDRNEYDVLLFGDRLAKFGVLPSRLAFDVKNLRLPIDYIYDKLLSVVVGNRVIGGRPRGQRVAVQPG